MLLGGPQDHSIFLFHRHGKPLLNPVVPNTTALGSPMRASLLYSSLYLFRSLSISLLHRQHRVLVAKPVKAQHFFRPNPISRCRGASVEHLANDSQSVEIWNLDENERDTFRFDGEGMEFSGAGADRKHLDVPEVEVKELSELPEQWRRAKLAWLCKELPAHKAGTVVRVLNGQRKWMRQEDATYIIIHCTRIRENETAFKTVHYEDPGNGGNRI